MVTTSGAGHFRPLGLIFCSKWSYCAFRFLFFLKTRDPKRCLRSSSPDSNVARRKGFYSPPHVLAREKRGNFNGRGALTAFLGVAFDVFRAAAP